MCLFMIFFQRSSCTVKHPLPVYFTNASVSNVPLYRRNDFFSLCVCFSPNFFVNDVGAFYSGAHLVVIAFRCASMQIYFRAAGFISWGINLREQNECWQICFESSLFFANVKTAVGATEISTLRHITPRWWKIGKSLVEGNSSLKENSKHTDDSRHP